ncbi:MAG: hypothetical protein HQK54_04640 [Oligoflexales bacterium]|nr:hypothetical protein [Oligoflexales bacterium]
MNSKDYLINRILTCCYFDNEKVFFNVRKAYIEKELNKVACFSLKKVHSLNIMETEKYDLLLISAEDIADLEFESWLKKLYSKIFVQYSVKLPVLIIADIEHTTLQDLFLWAIDQNWYFDIISPAHILSLPIRVANLIRISEHLREMSRYNERLIQLENQLIEIKKKSP